jgi:hypothetical protein
MVDSIGSIGAGQQTATQTNKAGKNSEGKVYGWMKEKKGNANGFKAHNKHYLNFQEQLKALEAAKQEAAAAQTQAQAPAETATTAAATDPTATTATATTTSPVNIATLAPAEDEEQTPTDGLDIAA